MDTSEAEVNGANRTNGAADEALPPSPPVSVDVVPMRAQGDPEPVKRKTARVSIASVALFNEDGRSVDGKGIGRKVIDRVHDTYKTELEGKDFAYDGEKSLFTVGDLPRDKLEFTVVFGDISSNRSIWNCSPNTDRISNENDRKRLGCPYQSKTCKVEISYATKIITQAIAQALRGQDSENSQEALSVQDIILRQHAAKQGCLLVRKSLFHNDVNNSSDVGGDVIGCCGFHSSFCATKSSLPLNIDVSTTIIIQAEPAFGFQIVNQNVKDFIERIWCLGPQLTGSDMVVILCNRVQYFSKIMNSCIARFQWASKEGMLGEENMISTCFEVCKVVLHTDNIGRGGGQVIPAARTFIYASQRNTKLSPGAFVSSGDSNT